MKKPIAYSYNKAYTLAPNPQFMMSRKRDQMWVTDDIKPPNCAF